jgi:MFS family permease
MGMSRIIKKTQRWVAEILAAALVVMAPGIEPYRLLANVTGKVPANVGTQGLGSGSAAGATNVQGAQTTPQSGAALNVSIQTALPSAISVTPNATIGAGEATAAEQIDAQPEAIQTASALFPHLPKGAGVLPDAAKPPEAVAADADARGPPVEKTVNRLALSTLKTGAQSLEKTAAPGSRFGSLQKLFHGSKRGSRAVPEAEAASAVSISDLESRAIAQYEEIAAQKKYGDTEAVGKLKKTIEAIEEKGGLPAVESLRRIEAKVTNGNSGTPIRDGIRRLISDVEADIKASSESKDEETAKADRKLKNKFWTGTIIAFIGGLGIAQIAQEFFGQSMPQLIKSSFGDFSIYASVMFYSLFGRILGNIIGGSLPDRIGLKATFLGAEVGRALTLGILVTLLITGNMSIPLYFGISAVNGLFTGVALTSEHSIPRILFGKNQALLEKFWGYYQFILEFVGIGAPVLAGYIISTTGTFAFTLGAYPLILMAAIAFFALFLDIPDIRKGIGTDKRPASVKALATFITGSVFATAASVGAGLYVSQAIPSVVAAVGAVLTGAAVSPALIMVPMLAIGGLFAAVGAFKLGRLSWSEFKALAEAKKAAKGGKEEKTEAKKAAAPEKTKTPETKPNENFFKQIGRVLKEDLLMKIYTGAKVTLSRRTLALTALTDAGFLMTNGFLYAVIAPAYGLYVMGAPAAAATVQAWVVGLYSFGSMLGSLMMLRGNKKLSEGKNNWLMSNAQADKAMQDSALSWVLLGTLSLAFFVPMIWTATLPAYAGVFLFGMASVVPMLKLKSLAGRLTPDADVTKVMGFIQMASSVLTAFSVWSLSKIFDAWTNTADNPTMTAFIVMNIAFGALGLSLLAMRSYLKKSLARAFTRSWNSPKAQTAKEWAKLDKNLARIGVNGYETRKDVKDYADADPAVVFLAPPSAHKLPIMQEGGVQSPGQVHLVFDAGWLMQEETPDGKFKTYVKKGLVFEGRDKAVVVEYETPRLVGYFADFFTQGANERTDGVGYEQNAETPMSSSTQLEKTTNDKLLTRMWMAAKGVAVPATMAFLMAAHPLAAETSAYNIVGTGVKKTVMPMDKEGRRAWIRYQVEDFVQRYSERLGEELVVKPSGPQWHSSKGVKFFKTSDTDKIIDHVIALSEDPDMTADGAILIDQRIESPALYYRSTPLKDASGKKNHDTWGNRIDGDVGLDMLSGREVAEGAAEGTKKDFNLGVYAMRTPWGRAKATDIMVRAGATIWTTPRRSSLMRRSSR